MGSKESVAAKIDDDTTVKIQEMNRSISVNRPTLIQELLDLVYDIKPAMHKNYELQLTQGANWDAINSPANAEPSNNNTHNSMYPQ